MSEKDVVREERIFMEILADACGSEEKAMSWYYYLDEKITFPFYAKCISFDKRTPLEKEDEVYIFHLSGENYCEHEIYVDMQWAGRSIAIPLALIKPFSTDDETVEAIEDWHYWVRQGYEF